MIKELIVKYRDLIYIVALVVLGMILNSNSFEISDDLSKERQELVKSLKEEVKTLRDSLVVSHNKIKILQDKNDSLLVNVKVSIEQTQKLEEQLGDVILEEVPFTDDSLSLLMQETYAKSLLN